VPYPPPRPQSDSDSSPKEPHPTSPASSSLTPVPPASAAPSLPANSSTISVDDTPGILSVNVTMTHKPYVADGSGGKCQPVSDPEADDGEMVEDEKEYVNPKTGEVGGRNGPEPTRFGDWEKKGRCFDF